MRGGIIFGAGCAAHEVEKFVPRYRPPARSSLDYRTCRMRIFAEFLIAYSRGFYHWHLPRRAGASCGTAIQKFPACGRNDGRGRGDSRRRGVRKSKLPRLPNADFCRMPPGTHAIFLSLAFAKSSFAMPKSSLAMPKSSLAMRRQILAGEPVRQKNIPLCQTGYFAV